MLRATRWMHVQLCIVHKANALKIYLQRLVDVKRSARMSIRSVIVTTEQNMRYIWNIRMKNEKWEMLIKRSHLSFT